MNVASWAFKSFGWVKLWRRNGKTLHKKGYKAQYKFDYCEIKEVYISHKERKTAFALLGSNLLLSIVVRLGA